MLDLGLERGINFGAHFIEVYASDCNDPILASVLTAWGALFPTPSAATAMVADFNGDGHPDWVIRNVNTQQTVLVYMNNNVVIGAAYGPTLVAGSSWGLRSLGDFNRDGHPDYALFNSSSGQTAIWYLSGPTLIGGAFGPSIPSGWPLVATADFNGDGYPDYVLYNAADAANSDLVSEQQYLRHAALTVRLSPLVGA